MSGPFSVQASRVLWSILIVLGTVCGLGFALASARAGELDEDEIPYSPTRGTRLVAPCLAGCNSVGTPAMILGPVIPPLPAYYSYGYASPSISPQVLANAQFPLQMQQMQGELNVTQAEIASLERRLVEYDRSNRWVGGGNALFESIERVKVALVEARQRYANLQYQIGLMQQFRGYNIQNIQNVQPQYFQAVPGMQTMRGMIR